VRILVTGHRGFVGRHLCLALMKRHSDAIIVGIDALNGDDVRFCAWPDNIDRAYHLAAQTDAQCEDAQHDAEVNILGTVRILQEYGDRVVLASSSMANYPHTPYGISKAACELYARFYGAAVVRFCNLFGDGGHSLMDRLLMGLPVEIRGSGEQRRTYAPVSRAVEEMIDAMPGTITLLAGETLTVNQLVARFPKSRVTRVDAHPLDVLEGSQL
jgi:nucleoside-diphosphate-sugar epimerase